MEDPWIAKADGVVVKIRLTPRGGRDGLDGVIRLADGVAVLAARVRAVPEDGAANRAVLALLAKAAGVPTSAVSLKSGASARVKVLAISGDPLILAQRLRHALSLA